MTLINKVYSLALGGACVGGLAPAYTYLKKADIPTEVVESKEEVVVKNNKPSHLEWVQGDGLGGIGDRNVNNIVVSPM